MASTSCVDKARLGRVAARAATERSTLAVGAGAVLAAPLLASWWVLAAGLFAVLLMVAWRLGSPRYWQKALEEDRAQPPRLPEALARLGDQAQLCDPSLRSAVAAISAAHATLGRVLGRTPIEVRTNVRFVLAALTDLETRAARLLARADEMYQYLGTVRREALQIELKRLEDLARQSSDPLVREEYDQARRARVEQLVAVDEIVRSHQRAVASLHRVVATVEGLPARLVRMRVLDAQMREDLVTDLDRQMVRIQGEIVTSEQALRELVASRDCDELIMALPTGTAARAPSPLA